MMNKVVSGVHSHHVGNGDDAAYEEFLDRVNQRFSLNVLNGKAPVFKTNATGLWEAYLNTFQGDEYQYHNCNTCKHFIMRYGDLVTVSEEGVIQSAVWDEDDAPDVYKPAIKAIIKIVNKAKVVKPFLSSEKEWGHHITGDWKHFYIKPPVQMVYKRGILSAGQKMAEKLQDFHTVMNALNEFTQPMLEQAVNVLKSEALYRSEKVLEAAEWLYNLHVARTKAKGERKANVVWIAVATAPSGFCHPRSSMIGTLLEDIAAGLSFTDVSKKFAAKMHPLQYQRPQAPPKAGNVAQAEKVIEQLGLVGSLARRFARLDDVQTFWKPGEAPSPLPGGVFGAVKARDAAPPVNVLKIPAITMTLEKFRNTVLPNANKIELFTRHNDNYTTLVTSADPDAPPILQWDLEDKRNPVSWYLYSGGSSATSFSLPSFTWVEVTGLCINPARWNGGFEHQKDSVLFILKGCKDTRSNDIALFPEMLKADLHGIRATIEAYSKTQKMLGQEEASAAGVLHAKGDKYDTLIRVNGVQEYKIDRWD